MATETFNPCNCIKEIKEKTIEHITQKIGANNIVGITEAHFENISYNLSGGPTVIGMPFSFKYVHRKANGDPEKRTTNKSVTIHPSYCPFCGTKLSKD